MDAIRRLTGRYGIPVSAVALATLAVLAFPQIGQPLSLAFYVAAVIASAWAGWRQVLLATGLSATALLAFHFLAQEPAPPEANQAFFLRWGLFLVVGGLAAYLSHLCIRASSTLEQAYEVLSGFGDGLIVTDVAGRIVYMNRRAEMLTGWQREMARDLPLEDVFRVLESGATRPAAALIQQALQAARQREADATEDSYRPTLELDDNAVLLNSTASRVPIEGGLTPIRNAFGTIAGVAVVFRDAERRRQLLHGLKQRIEQLEATISSIPAAILLFDRQGRCLRASDLAQFWMGCSAEECGGEGWTRRLDAADRDRIITELVQALPAGQCYIGEMMVNGPRGVRRLRLRSTPVLGSEGVVLAAAAVLDDLSPSAQAAAERRQAEMQLAAERADLAAWRDRAEQMLQQASKDFHRELAAAVQKHAQAQQMLQQKLANFEREAAEMATENQAVKTALAHEKAAADLQSREAAKLRSQLDELQRNTLENLRKQVQAEQSERLRVQRDLDAALVLMEQTEQQLRQERDRFKAVLDAAPCRIMVKDSSGRQWYSNHSAVAGKTDALSAAEWDAAGWTEAERRALETGEPILSETVAGENVEMSYCFRVALPGENEPGVATMSASYPLRVKEDQEIKSRCLALEEQTRDAQEHVAALERRCRRLETRSEFLEAVVDQHPDGLFVFDRECRFTLWNAAMGRLTGKSVDDVLGRSAFEVFPNWAEGEEWECLVAAAEGKQQTLTSGGPPWHEYVYVPLRGGDENPVGGIAAVRLIANTGRRLGTSKRPSPAQRSGSMPLGLESPRHEPSLPATALVPDDAEWLSYN